MLSNYYYYYSCLRLLVLLLSLLLQPQASIVTYSYEFLLPLLFYLLYHSCRCYLYILLLLYYTYYLLILFVTCHLSPPKEKDTFVHFWASWTFLAVFILYSPLTFYSVMRCLLPLPSTHSATGNFLMGAETTDILLQKHY